MIFHRYLGQWIVLRENLQETVVSPVKYREVIGLSCKISRKKTIHRLGETEGFM